MDEKRNRLMQGLLNLVLCTLVAIVGSGNYFIWFRQQAASKQEALKGLELELRRQDLMYKIHMEAYYASRNERTD